MGENSNGDVYRELQQHIDTFPVGFPATKSGVEIRLLKKLFTPEEAEIASKLKFFYEDFESLNSIHNRLSSLGMKYSIDELEEHLDNMAKKGAIKCLKSGNQKLYSAAIFILGMFEYQVNKLTKAFAKDTRQYLDEALIIEMGKSLPLQLRTIPVGVEIDRDIDIANFDDIKMIIENADGPLSVQNCICRQSTNLTGHNCKVTSRLETCIGLGILAKMYIDMGWAREISKEEAIEIFKKNEEEGLVIQPGNAQKPHFICSCCGCCCEELYGIKTFPNPALLVSTNHYVEIDPDLCSGCGTCFERCQLEAIEMNDDISSVDLQRCIGCGNCVLKCPSEAINLLEKESKFIPSETMTKYYEKNLTLRTKIKERELKKKARLQKK
ncbi:MAG: 4Fe-4S binding protein [Promethearchaeota archaeon]|jgi:Na+-translocating ferredoxin:NAD+ oxidoreductase RNF subunit RnfB